MGSVDAGSPGGSFILICWSPFYCSIPRTFSFFRRRPGLDEQPRSPLRARPEPTSRRGTTLLAAVRGAHGGELDCLTPWLGDRLFSAPGRRLLDSRAAKRLGLHRNLFTRDIGDPRIYVYPIGWGRHQCHISTGRMAVAARLTDDNPKPVGPAWQSLPSLGNFSLTLKHAVGAGHSWVVTH